MTLYGFVVVAWLTGVRPEMIPVPFATIEACEVAKKELSNFAIQRACVLTGKAQEFLHYKE